MTESAGINSVLDKAARDDLAVRNIDLVARVVGRMPITHPAGLDRDDLLSAGTLGLLTAARTYQPMRGASFRTFAYLAIKSAVLDEMRRHDPLPRGARGRLRDLERVECESRATVGRLPTPEEIAVALAVPASEVEDLLQLAKEAKLLAAEVRTTDVADDGTAIFDPADPDCAEPGADLSRAEMLAKIEAAIRELSPRERQVFVLYHSENMYLKEIGTVLEVTESRVCQILACAESKIRAKVASNARSPR